MKRMKEIVFVLLLLIALSMAMISGLFQPVIQLIIAYVMVLMVVFNMTIWPLIAQTVIKLE